MEMDAGGLGLFSYGGLRMAYMPGPGAPAAPVLAAQALGTSKPGNVSVLLGAGLAVGTYGYKLAYVVDDMEYAAGPEATIVVGAGIAPAEVLITLPAGVTDVNVYGRTSPNTETLLQRFALRGPQGQYLLPGTFLDQGEALDASGQKPVPANSVFRFGAGRLHRIHVPGAGGVPGNVTALDTNDPTGGTSLGTIYGPTTPAAGSITDVQAPVREGLLVQAPGAMTFALTYS